MSNNLVEVYSLWCGIIIAKENGLNTLYVFGDSLLIIKSVSTQSNLRGNKIEDIVSRNKQVLNTLELGISLLHQEESEWKMERQMLGKSFPQH